MKPKSRNLSKRFTLDPMRDEKGHLAGTFYSSAENYSPYQNPEKRVLSDRAKKLFESLKQQNLPTMALTGNADWLYENKGRHQRIDEKVKRKVRDLMKLKDSPENLRLHSNARAKSWRNFLKKLSPEERKKAIEQRKQISAKRKPVWKELNNAFPEIQKKFPWLKGFIVFGSFSRGKAKFNDIDLIPVFDEMAIKKSAVGRQIEKAMGEKFGENMPVSVWGAVPENTKSIAEAISIVSYNMSGFVSKKHSPKYVDFVGEKKTREMTIQASRTINRPLAK